MAALLPRCTYLKGCLCCTGFPHAAERLGFEPKFVVLETTVLPLTPSFYFPAMPDMELTGIEPVSRISTHAEPLRRFCVCSPV